MSPTSDTDFPSPVRVAVTGAYGYSGRYIARRLVDLGHEVITLTNSPARQNSFRGSVPAFPLAFDDPAMLAESMDAVDVLVNTYWVRFNSRGFCFSEAIENSRTLFAAAKLAGVRRVVHVSITNPDEKSGLEYFRGKAVVEQALADTGLAHTVLRPAVLFGHEDILVNNIAWMLRHLPVFGVFGDGQYKIQPIYVGDLADLVVRSVSETGNRVIEAIGPETFTYRELVRAIGDAIGCPRRIIAVNPRLGHALAWAVGTMVRDVVITREEIRGLMEGRLYVDAPAAGTTRLTEWARANRQWLGGRYASEMARRRDRRHSYAELRGG